mgnify:FL=1
MSRLEVSYGKDWRLFNTEIGQDREFNMVIGGRKYAKTRLPMSLQKREKRNFMGS